MLQPLLDEDQEVKAQEPTGSEDMHLAAIMENKPQEDPLGRDKRERQLGALKAEWSAEPLVKFLQGVISQIDVNIQKNALPTTEKLDSFVKGLVKKLQRQVKNAPKRVRKQYEEMFAKRYKIWNFGRNQKARSVCPDELRAALVSLIESLTSDFEVHVVPVQPRPTATRFRKASLGR